MELIKCLFLICILLLYPLLPGVVICRIIKGNNSSDVLNRVYVLGALVEGTGVCVLAFVGVRMNLSLSRFTLIFSLVASLCLLLCALICFCDRSSRRMLKALISQIVTKMKKADGWFALIGIAYLLIAVYYLVSPFSIEMNFDTPESVVTIVDRGELTGADVMTGKEITISGNWKEQICNLPVFYAVLCKMTGLSPAQILFDVVPYVALVLVFCVIGQWFDLFFGENRRAKSYAFLLCAMVTVFGSKAYMNTSYGVLHVPYEGMTLLSSVLLPLCFVICIQKGRWVEKTVWLVLIVINAALCAGVEAALVLLMFELVAIGVTLVILHMRNLWMEKRNISVVEKKEE